MRKIKLSRRAPTNPGKGAQKRRSKFEDTIDARRRIQHALDELNTINSKSDIADALARGVAFSHEVIQSRIHVGTDTLRKTNLDLFDLLKARILELERIWGGPLRGMGASGSAKFSRPGQCTPRGKRKKRDGKAIDNSSELAKLRARCDVQEKLLQNAQDEILDLTARLSVALRLSEN